MTQSLIKTSPRLSFSKMNAQTPFLQSFKCIRVGRLPFPKLVNPISREMAWSAENATKAYLQTVKMGKKAKEPDMSEFISALAAGNNAQLMVEACSSTAGTTTLALVAAAHQTGGRVVCIVSRPEDLRLSEDALGTESDCVEFVIGDARSLLLNDYHGADFVLIDCNLEEHDQILRAAQVGPKPHGAVIMGYNVFRNRLLWTSGMRTDLLPIGDGLQITRVPVSGMERVCGRRSRWVVRVDQCTGEEHVFRIKSPHRKELAA